MPRPSSQIRAAALPSSADLLALAQDLARLAGPSPAMDFRIAELFDLAPDPDSYSSELTPAGNGFDWRAPAFTADRAVVASLGKVLGVSLETPDTSDESAISALVELLDRLQRG